MEAFNRARNEQSFPRDTPVVNDDESLLIFDHVCSASWFIKALETRPPARDEILEVVMSETDDVPFCFP